MASPLPVPAAELRPAPVPAPTLGRLLPLDLMRGLVMMLMAVDHSSEAFNGGRLFTDSIFFYKVGTELPTAQFLTRWITHLCAPTFLFLAGTGLAFTVQRELARKSPPLAIDRYLLVRGVLIWAFELWISATLAPRGRVIFQVLYAIGTSYLWMIPLRRLPARWAGVLGILLVIFGEALVGLAMTDPEKTPLAVMLLLTGGQRSSLIIPYPTVHWLALMLLGWAWGQHLIASQSATQPTGAARPSLNLARPLALVGLWLLAGFLVIRGANRYGNMLLLRENGSLVQWLHVSKYPPSVSFVALELGVMCLLLAAFFALTRRWAPSVNHPLVVLGQTPMFFYLLHFPLLVGTSHLLGLHRQLGLGATYLGAAAVVIVLYPVCRWYRTYKAAHKESWVRFI